jgi:magnesium transporter
VRDAVGFERSAGRVTTPPVLTAFVFDKDAAERINDLAEGLDGLDGSRLLWIALRDPAEGDITEVQHVLELSDSSANRLVEHPAAPCVAYDGGRMHLTVYAASVSDGQASAVPIECVLGENFILTAHEDEIEVLEDFRERAENGQGSIGTLDAPSFAAVLLGWVVAGYVRAFEQIESELDDLDAHVMSSNANDAQECLDRLVELRRSIGTLRRTLRPHREVILSLAHPELDTLSSEESAERFLELERRLTQALEAARDAKESTLGSFDVLNARTTDRTNEIMKVLTLVTVILLPATVLGGIMGMNFDVSLFDVAWLFWIVIAAMLGVAALVLSMARIRRWI